MMASIANGAAGGGERGPGRRKGGQPPAAAETVPPAAPLPPAKERRQAKAEAPAVAPLTVGPREAAAMLGIGERTLSRLTADRTVPRVKLGARTLYRVADLERFIASLSTR